jgi:hypothetical protein
MKQIPARILSEGRGSLGTPDKQPFNLKTLSGEVGKMSGAGFRHENYAAHSIESEQSVQPCC